MNTTGLTMAEAIRIAKEAELKAAEFYKEAASKTQNPLGKELLEQLAAFENYHYRKLVELEESLKQRGEFIEYEARDFKLPPAGEIGEKAKEMDAKSMMAILTTAIDIEKAAQERYHKLAEQTSDPRGKEMFERLAREEEVHYRILSDEYYNLNNYGVWVWME